MKIPVLGCDPSLSNWGLAAAELDLTTGYLSTPELSLISPKALSGKQVRVNSSDIHRATELAEAVFKAASKAKAVFVEVPVGSQSARAMASYGICIGILGSLRAKGVNFIEVTPKENKEVFHGSPTASKRDMIDKGLELYPDANWPAGKEPGTIADKAEHMADAIAAIHAGVRTPMFQALMGLYQGI